MKCALLALFLVSLSARADYSLMPVVERAVLLIDRSEIELGKKEATLTRGNASLTVSISTFWMQDRIYSDGICCGIKASDPRSSQARLKEIKRLKKGSPVLVELVRAKGNPGFFIAYLGAFDAVRDFPRYYPKRTFYDTIKLELEGDPAHAKAFETLLKDQTVTAWTGVLKSPGAGR